MAVLASVGTLTSLPFLEGEGVGNGVSSSAATTTESLSIPFVKMNPGSSSKSGGMPSSYSFFSGPPFFLSLCSLRQAPNPIDITESL